jgi:N-acetylglucosamine kinase-like BadF-type ATPase
MLIIADSGSTKTDWKLIDEEGQIASIHSLGLNPSTQDSALIISELTKTFSDKKVNQSVQQIYYYGAGCWNEKTCNIITHALQQIFPKAKSAVTNDLLGASRAVCGKEAGIACILGTGANSCLFDGENIIDNVPALGYIMGDEGSGAYLGKRLLSAYFYRELPADLKDKLQQQYEVSKKALIENVYQGKRGNRYLAQFARFVIKEQKHPFIQLLIKDAFQLFIEKQVLKYEKAKDLPIHFVGSIAFYLEDILNKVLIDKQLNIGKIIQQPIDGLIHFHQ